MLLVALVCLSVCLFVYGQHCSNLYKWIGMKFHGGVLGGTIDRLIDVEIDMEIDG